MVYWWWSEYSKASANFFIIIIIIIFLLFHIQGGGMQVLLSTWEILAKDLFFDKISGLQPANAIKRSSSKVVLKDFAKFLGTAI